MRIGIGYDVHRLTEGRALILGGVNIPYEKGLLGHSDADVLVHAVMDAILGAMNEPDIGRLFPDKDPAYEGISSLLLLGRVRERMEERGYEIGNLDSVIVAQRPKMAPHLEAMKANIAAVLGCCPSQIGIKATTEEGLGFTGSGEGIAAQAICLLQEKM